MNSLIYIVNHGSLLDMGTFHIIILLLLEIGLNFLVNLAVLAKEDWEE